MIFKRLIAALVAASAFAAGAAVAVVALAFALYALVQPFVGRAGAAAIVALTAAVIMVLGGLVIGKAARPKPAPAAAQTPAGLLERALAFVRDKPILSASAAVGAGLLAVRNPKYLGEVLRSFLEGKAPPAK